MRPGILQLIRRLDVLEQTTSTNDEILNLPPRERHGRIVLAERQTAGKGQRGRQWQSPGGNVLFSIGWRFSSQPNVLGDLPLLAGVCICQALARLGLKGHGLKRPNDVMVGGAKLSGILVETRVGRHGLDAVTGIGINMRMDDNVGQSIDQPWTDLERHLHAELPTRNKVVSTILEELLPRFADEAGIAAYMAEAWHRWKLTNEHRADLRHA
jgi:BirA family biotin operon repressor/biotin-[acetyl-CoA-carboxylase] ligase